MFVGNTVAFGVEEVAVIGHAGVDVALLRSDFCLGVGGMGHPGVIFGKFNEVG